MKKYNTIIIGAGPAGLMASYSASKNNNDILILDKNPVAGKKLRITGKGRCNITNNRSIQDFIPMITRNGNFMYSSFYTFTNRQVIEFFHKFGTPTKVERGQRVFPASDEANDVVKSLLLANSSVKINYSEEVINITKKDYFNVKTTKNEYICNNLVLATGGITYPGTGSTGDGFEFANHLGHNIIPPKGSLLPIRSKLQDLNSVSGVSVKNASIRVYLSNKPSEEHFGEFMFTHSGLSGPIILTISDFINDNSEYDIKLKCDFKPKVTREELDKRLLDDFNKSPKQMLKTLIPNYFPKSLGEFLLNNTDIPLDLRLHQIDRTLRFKLIDMMKDFDLKYHKLGTDKSGIITKGGVDTLEINPSTLESKIVKNLYFAGEIIDVSGLTGGYNLQVAFSTGYLAGMSIK